MEEPRQAIALARRCPVCFAGRSQQITGARSRNRLAGGCAAAANAWNAKANKTKAAGTEIDLVSGLRAEVGQPVEIGLQRGKQVPVNLFVQPRIKVVLFWVRLLGLLVDLDHGLRRMANIREQAAGCCGQDTCPKRGCLGCAGMVHWFAGNIRDDLPP